jgi:hypothetical protein
LLLKCTGVDAFATNSRKQSALFRLSVHGFESLFSEMSALLAAERTPQVKELPFRKHINVLTCLLTAN